MILEDSVRPDIGLEDLGVSNPFPLYARMRENHPVYPLKDKGIWVISRYDDVKFAMERADLFSASGQKALLQPDWLPDDLKRDMFIAVQDPPEHTEKRALINRAFVGKAIQALIPFMEAAAQEQVMAVEASTKVNFIDDFARPYVCSVSDRITGADSDAYLKELGRWVQLNQANLSGSAPSTEHMQALQANMARQNAIFDAIIHDRRQNPQNDLTTDLIKGRVNGEALTDSQLRNALELVITAGFFAPTQMFCQTILYLGRYPELFQALKSDPGKIPAFFEEALRHAAAVRASLRHTTQDITLNDVTIPKGSLAFLSLASANHDPVRFPEPDRFDMTRTNLKQHLAFGVGPHICIGAALARQQMRIILEAILARFEAISIPSDEDIKTAPSWVMNVVEDLPITFH